MSRCTQVTRVAQLKSALVYDNHIGQETISQIQRSLTLFDSVLTLWWECIPAECCTFFGEGLFSLGRQSRFNTKLFCQCSVAVLHSYSIALSRVTALALVLHSQSCTAALILSCMVVLIQSCTAALILSCKAAVVGVRPGMAVVGVRTGQWGCTRISWFWQTFCNLVPLFIIPGIYTCNRTQSDVSVRC